MWSENEACWADAANARQKIVEGARLNDYYTSPCGQKATTEIGLCDACYAAIVTGLLAATLNERSDHSDIFKQPVYLVEEIIQAFQGIGS